MSRPDSWIAALWAPTMTTETSTTYFFTIGDDGKMWLNREPAPPVQVTPTVDHSHLCRCEMTMLMRSGCKCGGR